MRHIQTLTTRQLATALASREEQVKPNQHPSTGRVAFIKDRLDKIVDEVNAANEDGPQWDRTELRGDQPAVIQDRYVSRRDIGDVEYIYEKHSGAEVLDHEGAL